MAQSTSHSFLQTFRAWLMASPGKHGRSSVPCNQVALYTVNGRRAHCATRLAHIGAKTAPPARNKMLDSAMRSVLAQWQAEGHAITKVNMTPNGKRRGVAAVELKKQFRKLLNEKRDGKLRFAMSACTSLHKHTHKDRTFYYLPSHDSKRPRHDNAASSSSA